MTLGYLKIEKNGQVQRGKRIRAISLILKLTGQQLIVPKYAKLKDSYLNSF